MTSNRRASSWSQPEQYNALASMETQDFGTLFDFDYLSHYDPTNDGDSNGTLPDNVDSNIFATSGQQRHGIEVKQLSVPLDMAQGSPIFDMGMHMHFDNGQQLFDIHGHDSMLHHQVVPPTPNSVEIHADAATYLQQMDAQSCAMMGQYQLAKADAMNSFTPLGTPAVDFIQNEYSVSAHFSPLTSPMLEGEHHNGQHTSASSVATPSPIDRDVDMLGESAFPSELVTKKTTKKRGGPKRANGSRKVAQSPIQKPMQRKKTALSSIYSREMNDLIEATSQPRLSSTSPSIVQMPHNYTSSDSISPEPLSEIMGPPPKPASTKPSPAILGQSPNFTAKGPVHSPATPASLMRLQPSGEATCAIPVPFSIYETEATVPMLAELALPEAVISAPKRPRISRIDTVNTTGDASPRLGARKGTKPGMNTSIVPFCGPSTARTAPATSTVTSPMNDLASPVISQQNAKSRVNKKRGSMSGNVQLSPAIRPKISISPNILPLITGRGPGALNDQERTTFLASRSNYQNLIEGTNLPGVSYPSDLPTQLTSKRTSHKIAEQGRRQRINVALQKIQTLLPKSLTGEKGGVPEDEDDDEDEDDVGKRKGSGGGKGGGNSKAATVESAIVYIEQLQLQKKQWEERWSDEQATNRRENAELKRKVKELEAKLGAALRGEKISTTDDETV